jgi:hypothetical protein
MAGPAFDPNGAVRFDLRSGAAQDTRGARLVLLPCAALEVLDDASLAKVGAELGRACGVRMASRLGGEAGVRGAPLEVAVSHLAGDLAVAGVGAVHIERWGRALVAVVTNPGVPNDAFLGAVLASAIGAASGRELAAAPLGREGVTIRFLLASRATADRARSMIREGKLHAEVLAALQGAAS